MADKREQIGKKFILVVITFWLTTEVLLNSTIQKIFFWKASDVNDTISLIVLGLLMIQVVVFQHYQLRELIILALMTVPIILATLQSDNNVMMSTWIFVVASKYIDFDKLLVIAYWAQLIMTLFVLYLFFTGSIEEFTVYRSTLLRHSLGFKHPNQLGIRIFLLVICRCYMRRKRFNIIDWSVILVAAYFVNKVANSKTSFYALMILAVIMAAHVVLRKLGLEFESISNIMIVIAVVANAMSLFLSFIQLGKYPMLKKFDVFMSKRFSHCHRTMGYYGIKLFGQEIKLIINRPAIGKFYHFWLDNAYMSILLRYGPIVFLMFSFLYIVTMIMLKDMGQYVLVEILCLYAIYGIMENNFYSMSQNLFLLLLSFPIYKHAYFKEVVAKRGLLSRVKFSW